VHCEPGKGTTFKIYLPCANEDDTDVTKTGAYIGKQSGSVLLIDDEETMRIVGSEILTDLGYTVSICEDGKQGIEYYKKKHKEIDYVILDIMMPNLDGYSCLREMKKINEDVCVILSSGYTINSLAKDLVKEGARGFVQKPYDALRLVKAIGKVNLVQTIDKKSAQINNTDKKSAS
jgi:DNA-binding NtrC family response regulator